jgi:hypothetical protein
MEGSMSWTERRKRIYAAIAGAFASRTGISEEDFIRIYVDTVEPPPISDFETQYVPDSGTLDDILESLGRAAGIGEKAASHYDRRESFPQFAEHLLRAGAFAEGGGS